LWRGFAFPSCLAGIEALHHGLHDRVCQQRLAGIQASAVLEPEDDNTMPTGSFSA